MTKQKPKLNLILLGDIASGKATQAEYFAKKYKMLDFDMGKILRTSRKRDKKIDTIMSRTIDKGKLAPTNIVRKIFIDGIKRTPRTKAILFDGTPKMLGEAKMLTGLLKQTNRANPLVLYIQIPVEETVKRTQKRTEYRMKRADDSVGGLRNRAKYYRKNIREVVDYFQNVYTLAHIDGVGTKAEVRKRIQKAIDFYLKNYEQINQKTS